MKIALLYSGEARNVLDCYKNHISNIIAVNPEHGFIKMAYLWDTSGDIPKECYDILDLATPRVFEDVIPSSQLFPSNMHSVHSMYYAIQQSYNLLKEAGHDVDLVLRLRTDLWFNQPVRLQSMDPNTVFVPNDATYAEYSVNDKLAIGDFASMKKYCNLYNHIKEIINMGCEAHPESLLGFWLRHCGINAVKRNELDITLWKWK